MPKSPEILRDREKSLEEQFFAKHNEALKQRLRESRERESERERLARIAAIPDAAVLDILVDLGISADTWAAVSLVPLVEVAWADGSVASKERAAILAAAEASGITPGSPAHELLQGWLARRPDGRLLQAWGEYIVALCEGLLPDAKHALREQVLGRARSVAEATGGFLGLGRKISVEEAKVLEQLEKAFGR